MKVNIKKVVIGERIREDMGDLRLLERSISRFGLLNPIVINQKHKLLAGARRLIACQNLGWEEIEVHMIHTENDFNNLEIEAEENFARKDFTDKELDKVIEKKELFVKKGLWNRLKRWILDLSNKLKKILERANL